MTTDPPSRVCVRSVRPFPDQPRHSDGGGRDLLLNRSLALAAVLAALCFPLHAQEGSAPPAPNPTAAAAGASPDEATLYALGVSVGKGLATLDLTPSESVTVMKGFSDAMAGKAGEVDLEAARPKVNALAQARAATRMEKERSRGKAFREEAAKAKDAVVWPSGLIFTQIKAGTGDSPTASDTVKVHYRGTLVDGTEFDSSARWHDPATFGVNNVIRCWTEGLQKMKVGGKARMVCPAEIAYGDRGAPPNIPPGATLVFDVELVDIARAAPAKGAGNLPAKPTAKK
jgi:FKBP-type peptidyl-prolyl cis-trans isomerase FkpA